MTRSSRIRKPSQKAREIAEAALLLPSKATPPPSADQAKNPPKLSRQSSRSNQTTSRNSSSVRAKVKIGRKKGRATINSNGDVDVEEEAAKLGKLRGSKKQHQRPQVEEDGAGDGDPATQHSNDTETEDDPDVLYCICLGHDDHTPMIQCEGCENWFHFSCIHLDPTEAQKIEAFYCELCNASGNGITRKIDQEGATTQAAPDPSVTLASPTSDQPSETLPDAPPRCEDIAMDLPAENDPHLPTPEPVELKPETAPSVPSLHEVFTSVVCDSDEDKQAEAPSRPLADSAVQPPQSTKTTRRKQGVAEGLSSEGETSDEDLTGQECLRTVDKKRKTPTSITPVVCDSNKDKPAEAPSRPLADSAVQPPQSTKTSRRKQRVAEGLSSGGETSDEDFTGQECLRTVDKKRKTPTSIDSRPSNQPRISASTPSSTTPSTPTTPVLGVEKTRKACIEQFFKLFEPIFSKNMKQDEDAAMRFSEAVESELYESFGELDARNQKMPRRQYMTKLRSLLFNLKNNPTFLNSLSSLQLSPKLIVFMSNEDLQTPEQKALAEQIRQRSLQDSVKTLDPVFEPTTSSKADGPIISSLSPPKATDNHVAVDQRAVTEQRHFESIQNRENSSSAPVSPPHVSAHPSQDHPSQSDQPALAKSQPDLHLNKPVQSAESAPAPPQSEKSTTKCSTPNLFSSFDLEKVFAAIKSVPPPATPGNGSLVKPQPAGGEVQEEAKGGDSDDSMDLENTPEREMAAGDCSGATQKDAEKSLPDDYDPFVVANGVDADLEAILHGNQQSEPQSRPTGPLPIEEPESQSAASAQTTPSVWTGNVMTADVGGFAACATQVGGRPLSPDGLTWSKLLPTDTMTVVGRLPVKDSTNYLVQSHFAPSRELVLLELRPNLKGPPVLPSPERVIQHQQNLIEFFTKKGRHAVVAVDEKVKQAVRDIYLVPILRQDPLPEFVQLLDDMSIPESTPRARDIMLAVLVLSKSATPNTWKPTPNPIDYSNSSASAPLHHHQAPVAPPSASSPQHLVGAAQLLSSAPNQGRSPAPATSSSYHLPPHHNSTSSAPMDPIPLLQSLSSKISSVSSQLVFPLLSQMPPSLPATAPGPPPGFVPYVEPQHPVPPTSSQAPALNGLDLSKVDVSALQALLSSQQALQPIINQAQPSSTQPTNLPALSSSASQNGRQPSGNHEQRRHPALPAPPRPANLPLNPHFARQAASSVSSSSSPPPVRYGQQYPQHPQAAWQDSDYPKRHVNPYPAHPPAKDQTPRKDLMRMGEMIHTSGTPEDPRQRASYHSPPQPSPVNSFQSLHHQQPPYPPLGRSKRNSHEFVAPPRDGGWAGRGRGKKMA